MRIKKVYVYVEGPSDQLVMEALLYKLIEQKKQEAIEIIFFDVDSKEALLKKIPRRAVDIMVNEPNSVVIANECNQCFKPFVDFLKNLPEND
jgi:hypothetical protein